MLVGRRRSFWFKPSTRGQVAVGSLSLVGLMSLAVALLPTESGSKPIREVSSAPEASYIRIEPAEAQTAIAPVGTDFRGLKARANPELAAAAPPTRTPSSTPTLNTVTTSQASRAAERTCKVSGKVVSVADGDTITVLDAAKRQHKIRLAGIDAPEKAQPFGTAAKTHLSTLIGASDVCVDWHKLDKYGREVGYVRVGDKDVNHGMVADGYAWHYKKYEREQTREDRARYAAAEHQARSAVRGLWSDPNPIDPGAWRAGKRPGQTIPEPVRPVAQERQAKEVIQNAASGGMSCGSKRFCGVMSSCAEACFYLIQCGLTRLDGDNDGRPCESLCRGACE